MNLVEKYLGEGKYTVKYKMKKSDKKISAAEYDDLKDAKNFLTSIKKDGGNGIISKDGKVIKEGGPYRGMSVHGLASHIKKKYGRTIKSNDLMRLMAEEGLHGDDDWADMC